MKLNIRLKMKSNKGKLKISCVLICLFACFFGFAIWQQGYTRVYPLNADEIKKIEINHKYYLKWDKYELRCTKKQFDKIKEHDTDNIYGIEIKGNNFLEKATKWYNISIYDVYRNSNEIK